LRYRIIRLETTSGIALDVGLGALNFEGDSFVRSTYWENDKNDDAETRAALNGRAE